MEFPFPQDYIIYVMDLSENRVPQNLIKFDAESSSSPNKIINWGMLTPFSDIIIIIIPHTLW